MIREVPISPLTPAQERELERRIAASDRGEITYTSWETVKEWLRKSKQPE